MPKSKRPHVRWTPFQERIPTFEEWLQWSRQWPDAGLLLVLGPVSDVCVIDVDGEEAHDALLEHLGREPVAPKVISGSGASHKFHLYFKHPAVPTRASMTPWHPKLEFRGKGGLIVLPPSIHPSGKRYEWAKGRSLEHLPLPPLPKAVVAAITPKPTHGWGLIYMRPTRPTDRRSKLLSLFSPTDRQPDRPCQPLLQSRLPDLSDRHPQPFLTF